MGDGVHLAYDTGELRSGATGLQQVSGTADAAGAALRAAALEPAMFGLTPAASVFAAAVGAARDAQARGFRQEAGRSADLSGDSGTAAELGDGLTTRTAAEARTSTPGPR